MTKKTKAPAWSDALAGFASLGPAGLNNPLASNPLASGFSGGLEFMKNLWGGLPAAVPGFVVPTVDVEELDKRITDLKAVESWLAVNANMLRATIQSLEVQRNTVATLNSLGGDLSRSAAGLAHQWAGLARASSAAPDAAGATTEPAAAPPTRPDTVSGPNAPARRAHTAKPKATPPAAKGAPAAGGEGLSATAWLGFLQDQFNQVALSALAGATDKVKAPSVGSATSPPQTPAVKKSAAKPPAAKPRGRAKPRAR